MSRNLKLTAKASQKYQLKETEEYIEIPFVALSENTTFRPLINYEPTDASFTSEAVKLTAEKLKGKPLLANHRESVTHIIGVVANTEVLNGELIAYVRIPKAEEKIVALAKMKPSPIREVSIGGYITNYTVDEATGVVTINEFEPVELSLVLQGAEPNNRRLDAKKSKEDLDMQEEIKKLLAKNSELESQIKQKDEEIQSLKASLEEKEKEIQKLQAEKLQIELSAYKTEKLSEVPEEVRELLKASLEVAKTKEEVDKLTATFKEKLPKIQAGFTIPNPNDNTKTEDNPFIVY
ncbi:hypothetical protein SAMN06265182_1224 [Persephonella hydrogeniphila]|uniref:Phage prohead protease, HK97 family n=1 Tax=Persephonella hydrogeniphila TaxID=198703 RepID=A0A285NFI2_9AQUI|nr:hypothetical protein [Persephonella hydrogeniphila]SNZ08230.1 hypothetical protein SAMN06265182_1224 [Persephonella hydrogeniphila]